MSANDKVRDIEEHAAAQSKLDTAVRRSGLGMKRTVADLQVDATLVGPKVLSHRELLEASVVWFLCGLHSALIPEIASGVGRSESTARKILVSLCGQGLAAQTGGFGDERYRLSDAGLMKARSAGEVLAVAAAAPKGSPCSFPESWGQEMGA